METEQENFVASEDNLQDLSPPSKKKKISFEHKNECLTMKLERVLTTKNFVCFEMPYWE